MKSHSVFSFVVFNLCLVIGYTFSLRFYQPGESLLTGLIKTASAEGQPSIASLDNGQRSILLIGTSALDISSPKLESIWLATYLPTDATIQLLPVFPSGKQSATDFEDQLAQSFRLNKMRGNYELDLGFIQVLETHNFWWSGYIVFDRVSLSKLFNLVGNLELNGKNYSAAQAIQDLPDVQENVQEAHSAQTAILKSVCHNLSAMGGNQDPVDLGTLLTSHIVTSFEASQLQAEFARTFSGGHHSSCRFPTLDISMNEP